ncbi:UNVERIFIED_CONTAM: hypothetical protein K2H54_001579 [Gekko kuhli]
MAAGALASEEAFTAAVLPHGGKAKVLSDAAGPALTRGRGLLPWGRGGLGAGGGPPGARAAEKQPPRSLQAPGARGAGPAAEAARPASKLPMPPKRTGGGVATALIAAFEGGAPLPPKPSGGGQRPAPPEEQRASPPALPGETLGDGAQEPAPHMAAASRVDRSAAYRLSQPVQLSESEEEDSMPSPQEDTGSEQYAAAPRQVLLHRATLSCRVTVSWRRVGLPAPAAEDGRAEPRGDQDWAAAHSPPAGTVPQPRGGGEGERTADDAMARKPGAPAGSDSAPHPQQQQREALLAHGVGGAGEDGSRNLRASEGDQGSPETAVETQMHQEEPPGSMEAEEAGAGGAAGQAEQEAPAGPAQPEQWRAMLWQSGIEGPVRELLDAASQERTAPPLQPALQVWAFLVSRIDARDPGNRAERGRPVGPADGPPGAPPRRVDRAACRRGGQARPRAGSHRAPAGQSGEPLAWLNLSSVALQLADVERQLGWHTGNQDTPTLIAPDGVEAREAAGERRGPREHLGSEWWRATLRALLPNLWRTVRQQEEEAAAATAQQVWDATMRLTGFNHISRLLEAGRSQATRDWELALRVWAYLVAWINEYVGASPAPLPPDAHLWERLTVLHSPLQTAWADRRRGNEWELDIVAQLLTDGDARRRASPLPPWLTITTLAATLEDVYDDLQREEGQERPNVMALHAVEAWRRERDGPQRSLRRPEWTTELHRVGSLLYQHLLKERVARTDADSPPPDPGGHREGAAGPPEPHRSGVAAGAESERAGESGGDAAPDDTDTMEGNGKDGRRRRREWRAVLRQAGIREPVLGLLWAAEAHGWPEAETALRLWAYLASRINAPLHETQTVRAPTPDRLLESPGEGTPLHHGDLGGAPHHRQNGSSARLFPPLHRILPGAQRGAAGQASPATRVGHLRPAGRRPHRRRRRAGDHRPRGAYGLRRVALESWEEEHNSPQRPLWARRWQEQLHYLAELLALRPTQREEHGPSGTQIIMEWHDASQSDASVSDAQSRKRSPSSCSGRTARGTSASSAGGLHTCAECDSADSATNGSTVKRRRKTRKAHGSAHQKPPGREASLNVPRRSAASRALR